MDHTVLLGSFERFWAITLPTFGVQVGTLCEAKQTQRKACRKHGSDILILRVGCLSLLSLSLRLLALKNGQRRVSNGHTYGTPMAVYTTQFPLFTPRVDKLAPLQLNMEAEIDTFYSYYPLDRALYELPP